MNGTVAGFLIWLALILGYWLPTLIAAIRHQNTPWVWLVNTFAGWTVVGWFAALIMACRRS
jgi:hypothetical protein